MDLLGFYLLLSLLFLLLFYIALNLAASFYHNRNVYTTAAALAIWSYTVHCIHVPICNTS